MPDPLVDALAASRERTFAIVAHLDDDQLERQIDPIMSPLVWDLAHIAAYEDLWLVHRFAGEPLLHPELAARYDAFETPRAVRGEIELLDADGAREYLADGARAHAGRDRRARRRPRGARDGHPPRAPAHRDDAPGDAPGRPAGPGRAGARDLQRRRAVASGSTSPPGRRALGAADDVFAYDNERPRHGVELGAFRIARRPVTNATWLHFTEGGGYQRREWWSDEGWAWKEDYDIANCPDAEAGHPDAPVCHVSWFEADAFARSRGARLPTEAEWEKAATWTQGDLAGHRAGLGVDHVRGSTATPASSPTRTASTPRSSSARSTACCAAARGRRDPRVATPTFRNWDLPQRRQIFAGVRLATDPEES